MSSTRSASTRASSRRTYRVNKVVRRQRIAQQTMFNSRRNDSLAKRRAQGQYPRIRRHSSDLKDALQDLEEVSVAAQEQEIQQPSEVAFASARRLIHEMYSISPRRFIVYPMPEGYIAIDGRSGNDRAVMMMCGSDGDARCIVTVNGEDRRAHYSTSQRLPDDFVRQALNELETGLVS